MRKKGFTLMEVLVSSIIAAMILAGVASVIILATRLTHENYLKSRVVQLTSHLESVLKNDIRRNAKLENSGLGADVILAIYSSHQGLLFPVVEYKKVGDMIQRGTGDGNSPINNFKNFISSSTDDEKIIFDLQFKSTSFNKTDIEYSIKIQKLNNSNIVEEIETKKKTLKGYGCRTKLESM